MTARRSLAGSSAAAALAAALAAFAAPAAALDRPADPVVVSGAKAPALLGAEPGKVVAFAWRRSRWRQVPVQVDERKLVDLRAAYPASVDCGGKPLCYRPTSTGPQLRYADPRTLIGPDPDARVDSDDEVALMARDTGSRAPAGTPRPPRVVTGLRQELAVTDPLTRSRAYVYLFRSRGGLRQGAGKSYVDYRFRPGGGIYPAGYSFASGPNPESSTVTTPYYRRFFADRWRESGARITAPGATGVNVLDRNEAQFSPDFCGRSTLTFALGEGAFLGNRSGPVRAIRSVVGANSGPMSEREHVFYDRRTDETTYLRVHPIPGIMSFWDYSQAASGMRYADNNNPAGVIVDGRPDSVAAGPLRWESLDGRQGAVTHVFSWESTLPPSAMTSFYRDDAAASACPGDADGSFHGASGPWVTAPIGTTDGTNPAERLTARRTTFFDAPGRTRGPARDREVRSALVVSRPRPARAAPGRIRLLRLRVTRAGAVRMAVRVNGRGRVRAAVSRKGGRRVGTTATKRARAAGTVRLTVRLNRTGRRLARARRRGLVVRLKLGFRPAAGKATGRSRAVRIRVRRG
ncbi:MAG TPA: hypothetical protein VEX39_11885 [Thermoleophilaceae bacterium]|nr:hypothetical protein [Thermoleophilaceae bacterium]